MELIFLLYLAQFAYAKEHEYDEIEQEPPTDTAITSIDGFQLQKRHIGAMARSGWMPSSFRSTLNRFSRSDRTPNLEKIVIKL